MSHTLKCAESCLENCIACLRETTEAKERFPKDDLRYYTQCHSRAMWHEEDGPVLWWRGGEPPYVGTPNDEEFDDLKDIAPFLFWTFMPNPDREQADRFEREATS